MKWKATAIFDRKKLRKKAKAGVEILTYLTLGNLRVSNTTSVSFKDVAGS